MKGNSFVLVIVLLVGAILAIWGLWPRSGGGSSASEAQKDSLLKGEAVFWQEQQAYFRIRSGQWEKSTDLFDSPFTPVATEEASEMLTNHFKTGDIKNVEVNPDGNASPSSDYSNLIQEGDSLLVSGKNLFKIGNKTLAKKEFHKALLQVNLHNLLVEGGETLITQSKVDTIISWIAKCDAAIVAQSNSMEPKGKLNGQNTVRQSGSSASQKGTRAVGEKDNLAGVSPKTKGEEKKGGNDADKYWAKFKDKIDSRGQYRGSKEEAQKIKDDAPKRINGMMIRPLNPKNAIILDAVYKAAIK